MLLFVYCIYVCISSCQTIYISMCLPLCYRQQICLFYSKIKDSFLISSFQHFVWHTKVNSIFLLTLLVSCWFSMKILEAVVYRCSKEWLLLKLPRPSLLLKLDSNGCDVLLVLRDKSEQLSYRTPLHDWLLDMNSFLHFLSQITKVCQTIWKEHWQLEQENCFQMKIWRNNIEMNVYK